MKAPNGIQPEKLEVMMSTIKLWINAHEVEAKPGQTIMEAADAAGIHIPRLCYHPSLKASGSCRLCAVEIDGYRGLPAACSTPVAEGMRIETSTPKVQDFRREMLSLILQDHPRECLGCPRNGTCELQQLVSSLGIDFPYPPPTGKRPPLKAGGAYFERDTSLCVRCGRCVRICHEVRGAGAIVFREKAGRQEVATPFDRPLEDVGCQFCGACVDVCPVGALRENLKTYQGEPQEQIFQTCENLTNIVLDLYRKEMPRTWKTSICPVCSAGCRMRFELTETGHIVQVRPDSNGPSNLGQACIQGRFLLKGYLQQPGRLKKPLLRENGSLRETTWDAALESMAGKFKEYGPGETAVLTDGRATNEELYLLQKFAREVLKTGFIGCLAPQNHGKAHEVLRRNFGMAAATNSLGEMNQAGCLLAIGFNPPADHPVAGTHMRRAVLNGTKLIVANPCDGAIAHYADLPMHYYPGTELSLLSGLLYLVIKENPDLPALKEMDPSELENLKQSLDAYHPEAVSRMTGIPQEKLLEASCLLGTGKPLGILYGKGLLESCNVPETVQALVSLSRITGSVGNAGGGIAPLYGNGNLQGAWDMGVVSHLLPGQAAQKDSAFVSPEEILQAVDSGKIKALYVALEDYDGSWMDFLTPYVKKAEFVVIQNVVSCHQKRQEEEASAHVVLPMAAVLEKGGTLTNGERRVQRVEAILSPPGEARSLQWVLSEIAGRMEVSGFEYSNAEDVFNEIREKVPYYSGMRGERKAVQWPCPHPDHPGTSTLFAEAAPSWVSWAPPPPQLPEETPDKDYPFSLVSSEQLNAYFLGPLLAKESTALLSTKGVVQMNPADAFTRGLLPDDTVRVITHTGEWEGNLAMNPLLPGKMIALPQEMILNQLKDPNIAGKFFAAKVEKR
ncbi:molybdopterin-dependent oxidoreductase [Desulforhabdus amnigena]|jgi:predicted molibdopterin-dependent oxidoreductase YjgC|uniref:Formate dehydrogenase subunit alpha n=1 Tax=Desulforhabdus amnigena TaxID=40218 RepID=A0A9W6D3T7_9BACT|nr:molybdopterin-dependent oxidoreductase [Desulforhabdus amnigena]NLJ29015.1 molybdopterin-dependent oxidoreductase [Deltaproteobacteria bacterium]GLI33672.1 formate dehydrogenase subunit alpha [Desulforhabdus amnigena]